MSLPDLDLVQAKLHPTVIPLQKVDFVLGTVTDIHLGTINERAPYF